MRDALNNAVNSVKDRLPKRWALVLAGGGLFLAGLLIGGLTSGNLFAFAATGSSAHTNIHTNGIAAAAATPGVSTQDIAKYCQTYEQTVASELHVSTEALEKANADGLQAVLDDLQKDGKITTEQKTAIEQKLALIKSQPCQNLAQLKGSGGPSAAQQQALTTARTAILNAVASALNLSPSTLQGDLTAGQTILALAQTQHVALDTVNSAYLNAVKAQLAQAVSSHMLTQPQSDLAYGAIQQAVAAGRYPLLEKGVGLSA
jgi:hypothetical protein